MDGHAELVGVGLTDGDLGKRGFGQKRRRAIGDDADGDSQGRRWLEAPKRKNGVFWATKRPAE